MTTWRHISSESGGDVFWIMLPADPGLALPPERGATLDAGAVRVAQYRALGVDVWDVTAAARQVAKGDYHRAVRIAGDEAVADAAAGGGNPLENNDDDEGFEAAAARGRISFASLLAGESVLASDEDTNPFSAEVEDVFSGDTNVEGDDTPEETSNG